MHTITFIFDLIMKFMLFITKFIKFKPITKFKKFELHSYDLQVGCSWAVIQQLKPTVTDVDKSGTRRQESTCRRQTSVDVLDVLVHSHELN